MSSSSDLVAEVRALADQVARLTLRVSALESQQPDATSNGGSTIFVEDPQEAARQDPLLGHGPGTTESPLEVPHSREARESLADQLGDWVDRALQGGHRGQSGRDRLRLRSRIYVVFSDGNGQPLTEVRVFHRLRDLRSIFPRTNDPGDLIFLGFPSEWEARRATGRTSVRWPNA